MFIWSCRIERSFPTTKFQRTFALRVAVAGSDLPSLPLTKPLAPGCVEAVMMHESRQTESEPLLGCGVPRRFPPAHATLGEQPKRLYSALAGQPPPKRLSRHCH